MAMSPRNHDVLATHSMEEINALLRAELYDPSIVLGGNMMMSLCGQPSGASIVSPQPELCDILPPPPVDPMHFEPSAPPLEAVPTIAGVACCIPAPLYFNTSCTRHTFGHQIMANLSIQRQNPGLWCFEESVSCRGES